MAFEKKITLKEPTAQTLQRIEEVHFYLIVDALLKSGNFESSVLSMLENISDMFKINPAYIQHAFEQLFRSYNRPDFFDLALTVYYKNISIRRIDKQKYISLKTYYTKLNEYIKLEQPNLTTVLKDTEIAMSVQHFNQQFTRLFKDYNFLFKE